MISDINDDTKEIRRENEDSILSLFYDNHNIENVNKIDYLLKNENIETCKQIISNENIFNNLNNNQKLLVTEIVTRDKGDIQKYLQKIITNGDHELILMIAKNKNIYRNLNSENKKSLKLKLNKNPWINKIDLNFL